MVNNQKGQGLLIIFIMTTVIFVAGSAALALGTNVRKNVVMEMHQVKAQYAAEAGMEKALAIAKKDYFWLKNKAVKNSFAYSEDEKFFSVNPTNYPDPSSGSTIENVWVIKTGEDIYSNTANLRIESTGKSLQNKKTIVVDAKISCAYPEFLFSGIRTNVISINPKENGENLEIYMYVGQEGLIIPNGSQVTGNIYCDGKVKFEDGYSDIHTKMSGNIYAAGNVILGNHTQLNGDINIENLRTVTFGSEVSFTGSINVFDQSSLSQKMPPPIPDLLSEDRLIWYKENADFNSLPAKNAYDTYQLKNGIYYIEGNLTLSGYYTGQAVLIVNGSVNINSDLKRVKASTMGPLNEPVDCLIVMATGPVETESPSRYVEGYIYSSKCFSNKNNTAMTGGIIAPKIEQPDSCIFHFQDDYDMLKAYQKTLTGSTNVIKLIKWVNRYPNF